AGENLLPNGPVAALAHDVLDRHANLGVDERNDLHPVQAHVAGAYRWYEWRVDAEIAIRGGMVIDGTGRAPFRADVAVSAGRVVEIADSIRGSTEIDASGRFVCPGFVDIHTHYDPQVLRDPRRSSPRWHDGTP